MVGLGAAGLEAVRCLLDRGAATIGIDGGRIGGGASGRNGGLLLAGAPSFHHRAVRSIGRQRTVAIHHASLEELDRLTSQMPDVVRRVGSLRIAADDAELGDCDEHLAGLRADGLPAERYEGPEGRGLLLPEDAAFDPGGRVRRWAELALGGGADLHERSPALEIAGTTVRTPDARIEAERVIITVDGGLEALLPELGGEVRTARAQMLATSSSTDGITLPRPVYARSGFDYYQRLPDGRLAVGGGRDIGGAREWTTATGTTTAVQDHLERILRGQLGAVEATITHRWSGSIAFTSGGLPVLREVRPGVVACGGYSGTGNLLGPVAAREAVAIALDGRSQSPLATARG